MIDLLRSIVDAIASVIVFFVHSIESLVGFFLNIPTYVQFISNSLVILPNVVVPFAIASVTLYVMLMVINRK